LRRLAYAQAWSEAVSPAADAFRAWTVRYQHAPDAQARRPTMLELIKTDPQRALAVTVPATVRPVLPSAVLAELRLVSPARATMRS